MEALRIIIPVRFKHHRLDAALSETIFFRELLETIDNVIESPFVQRENPVRNTNRQEVTIKPKNSLLCSKCNGEIDAELKFCLLLISHLSF